VEAHEQDNPTGDLDESSTPVETTTAEAVAELDAAVRELNERVDRHLAWLESLR
jgi:hypothetical protein